MYKFQWIKGNLSLKNDAEVNKPVHILDCILQHTILFIQNKAFHPPLLEGKNRSTCKFIGNSHRVTKTALICPACISTLWDSVLILNQVPFYNSSFLWKKNWVWSPDTRNINSCSKPFVSQQIQLIRFPCKLSLHE